MTEINTQNTSRIGAMMGKRRFYALLAYVRLHFAVCVEGIIATQKENLFLWVPIIFACGVGIYFSLSFEPPLSLSLIIWALFACMFYFLRHIRGVCVVVGIVLLVVSGFTAGVVRTSFVYTHILDKKIKITDVVGTIEMIETLEEDTGSRILLRDVEIEDVQRDRTPRLIRLRLRKDEHVRIGQRVKVLAQLNPPSAPFMPGGFDFRRYLYFQGIGAIGFVYNAPEIIDEDSGFSGWSSWVRRYLAQEIREALPPAQASVAVALIVGQKGGLSDEDRQDIRDAGLAHMLAISGLHIGLVAGVLFFVFRLCFASISMLALRYPIKKIAAVCALAGAFGYMILAGATIPTQRAVLMSAIVFLAIILDRSPISLRLVAFSAFVVLMISPESLVSASFHMSFAAVTCLIYFYDVTRGFWSRTYSSAVWGQRLLLYFTSVCITTVIASLATMPFALYHFGQVSFIGGLSNLVAVPVLAFIVMPAGLLGVVLMPFGADYWPLQIMGVGIDIILDIARWGAGLPNAVYHAPSWGFPGFVLMVLSGIFVIVWRGWGKVFALPVFVWAVVLCSTHRVPDILIAPSHKLFAFMDQERDSLYVSSSIRERFIRKNWENYYGMEEGSATLLPYKGADLAGDDGFYVCGEEGCRFEIKGVRVSFVRNAYVQKEACAQADVLISVQPVDKRACAAALVIDKFDTWRGGAYSIAIAEGGAVTFQRVAGETSGRPWSAYMLNQGRARTQRFRSHSYSSDKDF